eukprot:s1504_g5.t1
MDHGAQPTVLQGMLVLCARPEPCRARAQIVGARQSRGGPSSIVLPLDCVGSFWLCGDVGRGRRGAGAPGPGLGGIPLGAGEYSGPGPESRNVGGNAAMEIFLDFNVSFQHIWLNVAFASSVPSDAPAMEVGEKHNLSNPRCVYAGFLWMWHRGNACRVWHPAGPAPESLANKAPLRFYLIVSLSNVIASTCQYEALKHVSFVVQMLGKSFKTIPVMIWGVVVSGKRYSLNDWLLAVVGSGSSTLAGLVLLSGFLTFDGLTSVMEEKLFKETRDYETSKWNQILYVNLLSSTTSAAALVLSGELLPALGFSRHAAFLRDASCLSLSAVAAQYFIYSQIREFGAVVFALTMNIRQVVSIALSYITYAHTMTWWQLAGIVLVFATLFYKSFLGMSKATASKELREPQPVARRRPSGKSSMSARLWLLQKVVNIRFGWALAHSRDYSSHHADQCEGVEVVFSDWIEVEMYCSRDCQNEHWKADLAYWRSAARLRVACLKHSQCASRFRV